MGIKIKRTSKKIDLMEMSDAEKIKVLNKVKESLRQKVVEAKLWQSFVESDKVIINGEIIHCQNIDLKGFSFSELMKNI